MSEYQKEKKKIAILLGIGVLCLIAFSIYGHLSIKDYFDGPESFITVIAIICYPIGIVYGGRSMIDWYCAMRSGDTLVRYGYGNVWMSIFWIGLALGLVITFGWLIGVVKAIKKMRALKQQEVA